jgi:hypothetical protein
MPEETDEDCFGEKFLELGVVSNTTATASATVPMPSREYLIGVDVKCKFNLAMAYKFGVFV